MKVRTRISKVNLEGREYRVIQPARPLVRAALYNEPAGVPLEPPSLAMYVGRVEAALLTALWGLATISPRSIVYLPMRHVVAPQGLMRLEYHPLPLDLVLMHHRLQVPLSRWKAVGALQRAFNAPSAKPEGQHETLRIGFAAETAFLTAGAAEFRWYGNLFREMNRDAGPHVKSVGGHYHYCIELPHLHIQYSPRWTTG